MLKSQILNTTKSRTGIPTKNHKNKTENEKWKTDLKKEWESAGG